MGWFFKRKSQPDAATPGVVIVKRSDFDAARAEPGRLVRAVVQFVNEMYQQGAWRVDEQVPEAQQVYSSDYYLAQVNNGGHAQFIWNNRTYLYQTCQTMLQGFRAMKAPQHLKIAEDLVQWLQASGARAFEETRLVGAGRRAPILDVLDTRFFALEKATPMTAISEAWIRSWPSLRVVGDAAYPAALAKIAARNPKRESRQAIQALFPIVSRTTDPMNIGFGLGLSNAPVPSILSEIKPGLFTKFAGENVPVFRLITTTGEFQGVASTHGTFIYPAPSGAGYALPTAADKPLVAVPMNVMEDIAKISAQTNAAVAISFLLKDCFGDLSYQGLGALVYDPDSKPRKTTWWIAAHGKTLVAMISEDAAGLFDTQTDKMLVGLSARAVADRFAEMSR
jgi:hypothetical protein